MTQKLILSIVTPEKQLVSEEVDQVNVRYRGRLGDSS